MHVQLVCKKTGMQLLLVVSSKQDAAREADTGCFLSEQEEAALGPIRDPDVVSL